MVESRRGQLVVHSRERRCKAAEQREVASLKLEDSSPKTRDRLPIDLGYSSRERSSVNEGVINRPPSPMRPHFNSQIGTDRKFQNYNTSNSQRAFVFKF